MNKLNSAIPAQQGFRIIVPQEPLEARRFVARLQSCGIPRSAIAKGYASADITEKVPGGSKALFAAQRTSGRKRALDERDPDALTPKLSVGQAMLAWIGRKPEARADVALSRATLALSHMEEALQSIKYTNSTGRLVDTMLSVASAASALRRATSDTTLAHASRQQLTNFKESLKTFRDKMAALDGTKLVVTEVKGFHVLFGDAAEAYRYFENNQNYVFEQVAALSATSPITFRIVV